MASVVCHICLRTDITAVNIATELSYFIDELCDYNIIENSRYKYCTICAHLLKKFYIFKQKCLKACKILKSLKGKRGKILPNNLHEQIPSSVGVCSLAQYSLLEHQYETDTDLLETKPDLHSEPNITSNNAEVQIQNLETADPMLPDPIAVKNEPMQEVIDYDNETMELDGENVYNSTTSDGNSTLRSNFEEKTKSIQLEANKEKLNTDGANNDGSHDNAKQSKIQDFLTSSNEEIQNIEDNVEVDDMEIKDTVFMLNNDHLEDDDRLNSMDDVESDIGDRDVESLPMDEQNGESDLDSLSDIEETKVKKMHVNELEELELAETLLKVDKRNILLKRRVQFLRSKANFKDNILKFFENDEYDLGDGVKISREVFLKIFERCGKNCYNSKDMADKNKAAEFLRLLYKMYNPEYETVFDIEYLHTEEKKLQEFNRRKDKAEYQTAPYQCARCYRGFQIERLYSHHKTKHDESSGPHECHICAVRFVSAASRSAHMGHCHSAVYVCRLCHVTFYYFASMQNHFNLHKGKEFPCTICNGIYRTATGLANHKRIHVTSHICTTCARSFVSALGLINHRKVKHKDIAEAPADAVRCAKCEVTLDSRKVYERHLRISHRIHPYACHCRMSFSSMAELRQHKVDEKHQHSHKTPENVGPLVKSKGAARRKAAPPWTCSVCQEELPKKEYKSAISKHYQERHPDVPYEPGGAAAGRHHLCEECGKTFAAYSVFRDHKNIHSGARPYLCPECPRTFATVANFRCHTARHRSPAYQCKLCAKFFTGGSNLSFHMRIHKKARRYKCEVCSASFITHGALLVHIRGVHHKERRARKINKR